MNSMETRSDSEIQDFSHLRVALVHDWLTGMRGGEKVLEDLCRLFPQADIWTLLHAPGSVSPILERRRIYTSFLNRVPRIRKNYRYFLPFLPKAAESLKPEGYDLILSSSHCVALGVGAGSEIPRLSYCHSPMRYVWDQFDAYFGPGRASLWTRMAIRLVRKRLQRWDVAAGKSVGQLIANSHFVAQRIQRLYEREASVIHPGVDVDFYSSTRKSRRPMALMVTALAPYKNVELALEAFRGLELPLVIIGNGPGYNRLRKVAPSNVTFLGWQPDAVLKRYYSEARFLIFPGVEDFGIVPVEAMGCGLPVVALGKGGVLESVREPDTGIFFPEATVDSLREALSKAINRRFDPEVVRRRAQRFSRHRFLREMSGEVERFMQKI